MPASGSHSSPQAVPAAARDSAARYGAFTIRPHRSLSDHALRRLLLVVGVTGGLFDLTLFLQFGWIVGVITFADIALVGLALALSHGQRHGTETVVVFADGVQVERRAATGRLLVSHWLPLFPISIRSSNDQSSSGHIELVSGSRHVRIGSALLANEREPFCMALAESLESAGAVLNSRPTFPPPARPAGFATRIQDCK